MKTFKLTNLILATALLFSSCAIDFRVKNAKIAGKYPKKTEKLLLLGELNNHKSCYDVTKYKLDLEVLPETQAIAGSVEIHATTITETDTIQIDLYENMELVSITNENQSNPVHYYRTYGAIKVIFKNTIPAAHDFMLKVEYKGQPNKAKKPPWDGGFVWKEDENENPWVGVACETNGASLWFPCKDHTSDEADETIIHLTVPKGLVGVANGVQTKIQHNPNSWTYCYRVSYPINTYNITLYVGDFVELTDTLQSASGNKVKISHYVLSYNEKKARKHFKQAKEQIHFFETTFGNYPWQRDVYRMVEAPYEGMEHQSAIAYGSGYKNKGQGFDYIVLHETGHEWWGNSVTARDLAHVWLQEGITTYSEAMYVEHKSGKDAYDNYLWMYRITIKNKRPLVGPEGLRYFDFRDGDVYTKGAWMLNTLRSYIDNDTLFWSILSGFYEENKYDLVDSEDFIAYANKKCGEDLRWFFDQYLYNRNVPELEYTLADDGIYYRWAKTENNFKLPIDIVIKGGDKVRLTPKKDQVQYMKLPNDAELARMAYSDQYFAYKRNGKLKKLYRNSDLEETITDSVNN